MSPEKEQNFATLVIAILNRLGAIIRYIAPGFVVLFLLLALGVNIEGFQNYPNDKYLYWVIPIGAALLGVLTYALHICVIVRIIWLPLIMLIHRRWDNSFMSKKEKSQSTTDLLFKFDTQRWKRRVSEAPEIKSIQSELDKWGAMQSFIYCSSYALIVISLLSLILKLPPSINTLLLLRFFAIRIFIFCLGAIMLICALISDFRHTNYEFRITREHYIGEENEGNNTANKG